MHSASVKVTKLKWLLNLYKQKLENRFEIVFFMEFLVENIKKLTVIKHFLTFELYS